MKAKKRLVQATATALLSLAVIGSGFSLWYFGTGTVTNENQTLDKNVTQLVEIGTIQEASQFTITFDQAASRDTSVIPAGNGITIGFGSGADTTASYVTSEGTIDQGDEFTFEFTTTISVSEGLAAYIDVDTSDAGWTKSGAWAEGAEGMKIISFKTTTVKDFDWTKVTFTYTNEPTDKATYNTFKGVVEASQIKVVYSATLVTND